MDYALSEIGLCLLGCAVSILGSLVGAGGGFILVPILIFLFPDLGTASLTCVSLSVVLCNASAGTAVNLASRGPIRLRQGLIFGLFTIPGALIGAAISPGIPRPIFQFAFGAFMLVASLWIGLGSRAPEASSTAEAGGARLEGNGLIKGSIASLFAGCLSSVLGIGGGIIQVPVMNRALGFPMKSATATSQFILIITASTSLAWHAFAGNFRAPIDLLAPLMLGAIFGGALGTRIGNRLRAKSIRILLAITLGLVAIRLLFDSGAIAI